MRYLQKIILSLLFLCVLGVSAFAAPQYVYNTRAKIWDVISDTAVSVNGTNITNINHANIAASTFPAGCPFGEAMVQIAPGVSTCTKVIMYNSTSNNYQAQHHLDMSGFSIMFSSGGTLGNASSFYVFPASTFTGDVDFGGNTAKNVLLTKASISNSNGSFTNLTATRATITNGSGIAGISGTNIASGTVADARVASTIARDSELAQVSDSGLVLDINFDEQNVMPGRVLDSSGYNHHAYFTPTTSLPLYYTDGVSGSKGMRNPNSSLLVSTTSGSYLRINNTVSLDVTEHATWEFWANRSSYTGTSGLIAKYSTYGGNNRSWRIQDSANNEITMYISKTGTDFRSNTTIADCGFFDGVWSHHVITFDKGTMTFYKNGVYCDTRKYNVTTLSTKRYIPLTIFADQGGTKTWNGTLDGIKMFNRTLTAAEAKAEYDAITPTTNSYVSQKNIWVDFNGLPHVSKLCFNDACTAYRNASCDVYRNSTHSSSVCI